MKRSGFLARARVEMKRGQPLRRTGRLRAKRQKPGVTGRPSVDRSEWEQIKEALWARAGGRCEVPWCRVWGAILDPHHLVKRSAGGPDALDNLSLLCRTHHEQTDAPYEDGRLLVTMTRGTPRCRIVYARPTGRSAPVSGVGVSE